MTKKEYLESLGYVYDEATHTCKNYFKVNYIGYGNAIIGEIDFYYNVFLVTTCLIHSQKDIDDIQIAFNDVKRDFEEMQKYED